MREEIETRCLEIGQYIAEHGATVRAAARRFGVSKSSVHKDMHERQPDAGRAGEAYPELQQGREASAGRRSDTPEIPKQEK